MIDEETEEKYYIPNGNYWKFKKLKELKNNINSQIFDISNYI